MELYHKIRKSRLPWYLFYIGLTMELIIVIVDKSNYTNPIEGRLFQVTFLLFFLKMLLTAYTGKEWGVILFLELIGVISYRVTGGNDLIRLVTFVAACKEIPLRQMLRYAFYVTLVGCTVIVLLSVSGIYGEISLTQAYGRESAETTLYIGVEPTEETRYTLGMGHPNALACMFLMLAAMGTYVYFEQMKWYSYLFLMLLNAGVYKLAGSKTSMLITTAFLAGACAMRYCRFLQKGRIAYLCGLLVFAVCIGFSVDAAVCAQRVREAQWNEFFYLNPYDNQHIVALGKIDQQISGRIKSLTETQRKDGMIQTWSLFSEPENRKHYFDMGWVKLFYRYGIVPGLLYVLAQLALLWKMYRRRDACGLVVFVVMAVYTVVEAHLISVYIGRNFLMMMMGSYFLPVPKLDNQP
ncbi:MAG: hypothetical protein K1W10_12275 [Lachnospiraceae bacterium]